MFRRILLLLALPVFAAGCTSSTAGSNTGATSATEDFRELAGVYEYMLAQKENPPRDLKELQTLHSEPLMMAIPRIESGEYVVFWGVSRTTIGAEAEMVLAYEKNAPHSGGVVLLRNGTVKNVSAQEFAALRKPR